MSGDGFGPEGAPFAEAEDLEGFKRLSEELAPETRDLALALRGLFKAQGRSLRAFAARSHFGASTVSRYLAGERLPEKHFLDALIRFACEAHGQEVTAEVQSHLYRLHREALATSQPARYREQMASDRLEDAILQCEQAELQIQELRRELSLRSRQLQERKLQVGQLEAGAPCRGSGAEVDLYLRQRDDLARECERLREAVETLTAAVEEAVHEREAVQRRCVKLEAELAAAQDQAEREELRRQAAEEQLRLARAAGVTEQRLADLDRVRGEAEQVRLAAARDAAKRLEDAEAEARKIIEAAGNRVARIRPSVVSRSAALRLLRDTAVEIAEERMPRLVDELSRTDPSRVDTRISPIPIVTSDEIGQIARAFEQVHREAVRLAVEQAMLQNQTTEVFLHLERRNQSLLDSQLALLSDLENGEADPGRQKDLFRLDHLATRMRRNSENLLALAGEKPLRHFSRPVPLTDVLSAAVAEIEQYERVRLHDIPTAVVHGHAVIDVVHLLAELIENAALFSPPETTVGITASLTPDNPLLIEIHDAGLGFTAEGYHDINTQLAQPAASDTLVNSHRMGIYTAGRLAARHGIRIQVRPSATSSATTTAQVVLPIGLTARHSAEDAFRRQRSGAAGWPGTATPAQPPWRPLYAPTQGGAAR
ncbi:ATP-binding protein [Streptomyces sp. MAI_2237]